MVTVNPRSFSVDKELIEAYKKILAPSLGHFLDSGMDPAIRALWNPVKLVGPALTVQTTPGSIAALGKAVEFAQPGDVIVMSRGGEHRYATTGDFAVLNFQEKGIAGMVTDGLVTDQRAIEELKFPVFCRGVSAIIAKRITSDEGGVNVPVEVGGMTVNPGDLVVADEGGVIVASFEEARAQLGACLELEEWEEYARGQLDSGKRLSAVMQERQTYRQRVR